MGCAVRRYHPVLTPTYAPTESSVSPLLLLNMQRQYGFGNDDKCVSGGGAANENHHYLILFGYLSVLWALRKGLNGSSFVSMRNESYDQRTLFLNKTSM